MSNTVLTDEEIVDLAANDIVPSIHDADSIRQKINHRILA